MVTGLNVLKDITDFISRLVIKDRVAEKRASRTIDE